MSIIPNNNELNEKKVVYPLKEIEKRKIQFLNLYSSKNVRFRFFEFLNFLLMCRCTGRSTTGTGRASCRRTLWTSPSRAEGRRRRGSGRGGLS